MLRAWIERASRGVASECAVCRAWPARPLCEDCVARFAPATARCSTCALALPAAATHCGACLRQRPPLDRCFAAVAYGYPWSGCIGHFKFERQPGWAAALAGLLLRVEGVEHALAEADAVLALPLAPARLKLRGFNQAHELACHLAPGKADARSLLRIRDTRTQSELPRAERQRNMAGAFAVEPVRAAALRGRRLVLVDDVMTSGATLFAAAEALRTAGAAQITGMVVARTDDGWRAGTAA